MIVLITPTGARRDQFNLCTRWMQQQDYTGSVVWIIVDDARPVTTNVIDEGFKENWTTHKVYPKPEWRGENTQARNIQAGLTMMKKSCDLNKVHAIFIIEDDDYYRPSYLRRMMQLKGTADVFGETNTIYYNVAYRRYIVNGNRSHASLFQTAFTVKALSTFEASLHHKFIDAGFWKICKNKKLFFDNYLSVGIKGMPGRKGIGAGHSWFKNMHPDLELNYLVRLIGKNDAKQFERYYRHHSKPRQPLFVTKRR